MYLRDPGFPFEVRLRAGALALATLSSPTSCSPGSRVILSTDRLTCPSWIRAAASAESPRGQSAPESLLLRPFCPNLLRRKRSSEDSAGIVQRSLHACLRGQSLQSSTPPLGRQGRELVEANKAPWLSRRCLCKESRD